MQILLHWGVRSELIKSYQTPAVRQEWVWAKMIMWFDISLEKTIT